MNFWLKKIQNTRSIANKNDDWSKEKWIQKLKKKTKTKPINKYYRK